VKRVESKCAFSLPTLPSFGFVVPKAPIAISGPATSGALHPCPHEMLTGPSRMKRFRRQKQSMLGDAVRLQ